MVELRTQRLWLRPFVRSDAPCVRELAGDWAVARMLGDMPYPMEPRAAERYIRPQRGERMLAIVLAGAVVGAVSYFRTEKQSAELGFWLGRPWWGQGLAVEAAAAVVAYGFGRDRLRSFTSGHFLDNPGSARVLEQLGFRAVGSAEVWAKSRGAWVASVRHRLDRPGAEDTPRRAMSWLGRATMI